MLIEGQGVRSGDLQRLLIERDKCWFDPNRIESSTCHAAGHVAGRCYESRGQPEGSCRPKLVTLGGGPRSRPSRAARFRDRPVAPGGWWRHRRYGAPPVSRQATSRQTPQAKRGLRTLLQLVARPLWRDSDGQGSVLCHYDPAAIALSISDE